MDNFRVFEPIVGFNASAHAQSLSWFIFNDLGYVTEEGQRFSVAAWVDYIYMCICFG